MYDRPSVSEVNSAPPPPRWICHEKSRHLAVFYLLFHTNRSPEIQSEEEQREGKPSSAWLVSDLNMNIVATVCSRFIAKHFVVVTCTITCFILYLLWPEACLGEEGLVARQANFRLIPLFLTKDVSSSNRALLPWFLRSELQPWEQLSLGLWLKRTEWSCPLQWLIGTFGPITTILITNVRIKEGKTFSKLSALQSVPKFPRCIYCLTVSDCIFTSERRIKWEASTRVN